MKATVRNPEATPPLNPGCALVARDGRVFLEDEGLTLTLGHTSEDEAERIMAATLSEALPPESEGDWKTLLLKRLGERAIDTAHYEGPFEFEVRRSVPRRKLSRETNLFVGEGMFASWQAWFLDSVVLPHANLLRRAFPEELAEAVDGAARPLARWFLKRSVSSCPADAADVLREARTRLPKSVTEQFRLISRSNEWVVHRILNGMCPAYLRRVSGNPQAYDATYLWDEARFKNDGDYVMPSARARLVVEQGQAVLAHLEFRYPRDSAWQRVIMSGADRAPAWKRERARRAFCGVYLFAGEVDRHIVLGHLLTEFVLVGIRSVLSKDHPIRKLLLPFVQYTDVINHFADQTIWGPFGVLVLGSPFSAEGLGEHFAERLGAFDWRGFSPHRRPLVHAHYAPSVQEEFWQCVRDYVDDAFVELDVPSFFPRCTADAPPEYARYRDELVSLSAKLREQSVEHQPYDQASGAGDFWEASELAFRGGGKSFSAIETLDELRQFCAFAIYAATLGHGWSNVRQYEDGGEPEYATFALRRRIDDPAPPADGDDSAWHAQASISPCDQAYQVLQAYGLSYFDVASLTDELHGPRVGDALVGEVLVGERSLSARVLALAPRIAAIAERNRTGVPDPNCDATRIPARPCS
jgi:hypothetical protein